MTGATDSGVSYIALLALIAVLVSLTTVATVATSVARELRAEGAVASSFPFIGLRADYACVSLLTEQVATEGGGLDDEEAWLLLGEKDDRYVLWTSDSGYRRVAVDQVILDVKSDDEPRC
ncbi:hypothetical protein [Geodermatophilus sp. FMUSA9-8]|uniref:hypothetical protein n=1 Tax=Geodermatophilus sp. FMUSA9-8 TaxID=3120155 RepID=UPI00300898A8